MDFVGMKQWFQGVKQWGIFGYDKNVGRFV